MKNSKVIFLASTTYTGSTMFSALLGAHPQIVTISELTGINPDLSADSYVCSCGKILTECDFFRDVAKAYKVKSGKTLNLNDFDVRYYKFKSRLLRNLCFRSLYSDLLESLRDTFLKKKFTHDTKRWLENTRHIIDAACQSSDRPCFLDASKDPSRIPYLQKLYGKDLVVVHLVRDPRGFVNSRRKHKNALTFASAFYWRICHRNIERLCEKHSVKRIVVQYEDIVTDATATVNGIAAVANLKSLSEVSYEPEKLHLIGNATRLKDSVELKQDVSWRSELSQRQISLVGSICVRQMQRLGYSK